MESQCFIASSTQIFHHRLTGKSHFASLQLKIFSWISGLLGKCSFCLLQLPSFLKAPYKSEKHLSLLDNIAPKDMEDWSHVDHTQDAISFVWAVIRIIITNLYYSNAYTGQQCVSTMNRSIYRTVVRSLVERKGFVSDVNLYTICILTQTKSIVLCQSICIIHIARSQTTIV